MTKITVGLCVKNSERTVKRALDSILHQSSGDELLEVIVVDGYSSDRTLDIVKEALSKSDVKYGIFYENEGLGVARQIVVDNAEGDYIVWVDSDMILSRDYIREQAGFMEKNPSVGIAKGKYKLDLNGDLVTVLEKMGRRLKYLNHDYVGEAHESKAMATEGCIYRVEAIKQVGGFDKNIERASEDWDAEYMIRKAGWKLFITDVFFSYSDSRITWKNLWGKYFDFGYGSHYVCQKHKGIERLPTMLPPVAFFSGVLRSLAVFKVTGRKVAFLLPFHFMFNMIAWNLGFIKGHLNSHKH